MYSPLDPKITDEARNFGFKVKEKILDLGKNILSVNFSRPHQSINNYRYTVLNLFIAGCKR